MPAPRQPHQPRWLDSPAAPHAEPLRDGPWRAAVREPPQYDGRNTGRPALGRFPPALSGSAPIERGAGGAERSPHDPRRPGESIPQVCPDSGRYHSATGQLSIVPIPRLSERQTSRDALIVPYAPPSLAKS